MATFSFVPFLVGSSTCVAQVGEFSSPTGEILDKGQTFRLDLDAAKGDKTRVMLPHPEIIEASEVGHTLMVDDGKVRLKVIGKGKDFLDCSVEVPGKISNRKGVNTPDSVSVKRMLQVHLQSRKSILTLNFDEHRF